VCPRIGRTNRDRGHRTFPYLWGTLGRGKRSKTRYEGLGVPCRLPCCNHTLRRSETAQTNLDRLQMCYNPLFVHTVAKNQYKYKEDRDLAELTRGWKGPSGVRMLFPSAHHPPNSGSSIFSMRGPCWLEPTKDFHGRVLNRPNCAVPA
jgi:hypothetical protein